MTRLRPSTFYHCHSTGAVLSAAILAVALVSRAVPAQARTQWLLSYDGTYERSAAQPDFYRQALSGPASHRCSTQLFDGVIFLGTRAAESGRWMAAWMAKDSTQWADSKDWFAYLDSLTSPNGVIHRLDEGARAPIQVAVMLPALARSALTMFVDGEAYDVSSSAGVAKLYAEYLERLQRQFSRLAPVRAKLTAVYWLDEAAWSGDSARISAVAREVHRRSLQFLWIPYFDAGGATHWRSLGFDAAWQQPNFFFHADLPRERLDVARQRADSASMGLELEFDARIFADSAARRRLDDYLDLLHAARLKSIAVYDGGGGLYRLFSDTTQAVSPLRRRVAQALCSRQ